jgi:Flp pilus assembly pilin Flp
MQFMLIRLWRDEAGFVQSSESVLLGTILLIGSIAGLVTVRDAVATEFGDLATALLDIDHSYSYAAIDTDCGAVAGSFYVDELDFCAPGFSDDDPPVRLNPVVPGIPPSGGEGD